MNNRIETLLNYLLDTETTSEAAFIETIGKSDEFFHSRYLKEWEPVVNYHLTQINRNAVASASKTDENGSRAGSDSSDDEAALSSSDDEEDQERPQPQKEGDQSPVRTETVRSAGERSSFFSSPKVYLRFVV